MSKAGKEKLKARLVKLRAAGATLSKLPCDEASQLRATLRRSRRQKTTLNARRKENARLHRTVRKLETRKAALEVQPAKLRAIRKALESELAGLRAVRRTLSKSLSVADADLRRTLRRSRRQKATIKSLSRENARLRKGAKTSRNRIETLEVQLERLRATGAVLSRALYGRKSEQQDKPGSERKRGQQRGAPGHGRTQRPGLDERTEEHNPPPDDGDAVALACLRRDGGGVHGGRADVHDRPRDADPGSAGPCGRGCGGRGSGERDARLRGDAQPTPLVDGGRRRLARSGPAPRVRRVTGILPDIIRCSRNDARR